MQHWTYLLVLIISLAGLAFLDWRQKLAFFHDARRTTIVLVIAVLFFAVWDFAGIYLGIFWSGASPWMLGIYLAPEFPVEEVFFLLLLNYLALLLFRGMYDGRRHLSRS